VVSAAQSGLHIGQNGAGPSTKLGVGSDDFEDMMALQEGDWDTEATYDLVEQTRGLLVLADRQNLNLFASSVGASPSVKAIPVRGKRKAGRFSAITSPTSPSKPRMGQDEVPLLHAEQASAISGPSLLKRILAVLRSLVLVDCLHRTPLFRPLCPPNALQAACLDIAGYLYHKCGIDTKLEVVDTIVDGFHGMGEGMVERVCEWLEGRLGELLGRLARERGGSSRESSDWNDPFAAPVASQPSVPIFAFSTEPPTKPPSSTSPGWMRFSPATPSFPFIPTPNSIVGLLSTHSTSNDNPTTSLHIASLVTRIFAVITSTVDMTSAKLTTIHRVHRLLSLVLIVKPDAAINLLEIVALAPPSARRTAMEILNTFYPSAMGHNVIARRLASTTYLAQRTKWETGQERVFGEDATGDHHFVTWRVSSRETPGSIVTPCATCHKEMHGFCLRCTLCRDVCHLHCFQPIEQAFKYEIVTLSAQESVPQTAYVKFSDCMARLNEQVIAGQSVRGHPRSTRRRVGGHDLHLVNLFNLTLCDDCHEPLWGSTSQGYACMNGCQRFYHTKCTDRMAHGEPLPCKYGREVVIDEISAQGRNPFVISFSALQASFDREIGFTCLSEDELAKHSYDEVAVLHGALWTQYQIFKNGMSSGSIRITTEDLEQRNSDPLELHEVLTSYEVYLQAHDMGASNAAMDFAHVSGSEQLLGQGYLFSDRYLTYSTALLRAPSSGSFTASRSEGLRTAQGFQEAQDSYGSGTGSGAYEMLDLSALRRGLASDFNIHGERVAALFLDQLRSIGLCTYTDQKITADDVTAGNKLCYFILPLLMDSSPTVELLILAIETSLDDLDLTMNEQAFQLLISRAWPSLLCSPCALERLGHAVVSWVMAQVSRYQHKRP